MDAATNTATSAAASPGADASTSTDSFSLRPTFMQKFRPPVATKFMQQVLDKHLMSKVYQAEECQLLSKVIAEEIKSKLIGKKHYSSISRVQTL
ncbi:hypothetical protein BGX31_002623 [Mortierella sp. GBA43]|nr:hypothetical protein BGX31_002623 [Mortierella sp. GBA43]